MDANYIKRMAEKIKTGKNFKILMGVPPDNAKGGPPLHLPYLVEYFNNNSDFAIKTLSYGSSAGHNENKLKKMIRTSVALLKCLYYIIFFRPDIIHLNSAFDKFSILRDLPFSILSLMSRQKLIFKIHGSHYDLLNTNNFIWLMIIKLYMTGATKIGVLSKTERDEFIKNFGAGKKLTVVKNILPPFPKNTKNSVHFEKNENIIYGVFISRIVKGKGLKDIIYAMPDILKRHPAFTLVIAGDGEESEACVRLAADLKVNRNILWLSHIRHNEIPQLLHTADIFIFPSHYPEGMPMALVEALRSGIPIITTRVRFAKDYLKEKENCLFIQRGDPADIANKTVEIINNGKSKEIMRINNPILSKEFSMEIVGAEFEKLYHEITMK